jgi:short-subunit dehydrogenase
MDTFKEKYGPWALITGASRGLGAEFAVQCAGRGLNLILVATNEALLRQQKELLEKTRGIEVRTVALDLGREDILGVLGEAAKDCEIGLLICNAGISSVKPFFKQEQAELLQQFYVNARSALLLTRHYGDLMQRRQRGGIILLSSASALYGTAYSANYAGTKAYNLILGESLWYEMKGQGVDVLGFMPGCTKTPGFDKHNPRPGPFVPVMTAGDTVADALKSLGSHPSRIAGRVNRLAYFLLGRLLSRRGAINAVSGSMGKIFRPFE